MYVWLYRHDDGYRILPYFLYLSIYQLLSSKLISKESMELLFSE